MISDSKFDEIRLLKTANMQPFPELIVYLDCFEYVDSESPEYLLLSPDLAPGDMHRLIQLPNDKRTIKELMTVIFEEDSVNKKPVFLNRPIY